MAGANGALVLNQEGRERLLVAERRIGGRLNNNITMCCKSSNQFLPVSIRTGHVDMVGGLSPPGAIHNVGLAAPFFLFDVDLSG